MCVFPASPIRSVATGITRGSNCGGLAVCFDRGGWPVHYCTTAGGQREPIVLGGSQPGHVCEGAGRQDSTCGCKLLHCHQVVAIASRVTVCPLGAILSCPKSQSCRPCSLERLSVWFLGTNRHLIPLVSACPRASGFFAWGIFHAFGWPPFHHVSKRMSCFLCRLIYGSCFIERLIA